ncbi:hypothetical protein GCM10010413_43290 [Promicromonospora sukumoe]|uniref:Hpt domain-containing protein n=1 Tax=Promicromonospora sukumoe TaxID=88382 RepID=A0A7W3JDQ5_9MICO|nr:hypothetical protein [Promicromonospora sukumoe]MBA8810967.1 hypothetical protein [Promicromonospora sukumoe]
MSELRDFWTDGDELADGTGRPDGDRPGAEPGDFAGEEPARAPRELATDILDEGVLRDLAQDLGGATARRLAEQYAAGLKRRLELLTVAALDRSGYAVYDTAAGLAVSGAMVGAVALARAAWAVAQDVVRTRAMPSVETLEQLMRLAHDTEVALVRHSRTGTPAPEPCG